jgi:L-xylulokinase
LNRRAAQPYLLGVDSGLTVTKAVVYDLGGRAVALARAESEQRQHPGGRVEKDPDEQWRTCASAIADVMLRAAVPPSAIAAVGLTGHGDGAYVVDEDCRPVRAAVTSLDSRAAPIVDRWRATEVGPRALALTGELPFAQHAPAILAWLKANEPASYARVRWVLYAKDWLKLQLTGRVTTDPTDASATFTGVADQTYSREALGVYGLDELWGRLPPIVPSTEVVGRVTAHAAGLTGLAAGTPVVSGLHDVDASALGAGCVRPGQLTVVAGTYSVNEVISDRPEVDGRWLCRNWLHPGRWMLMSTSPTSATNLEWFVRRLCHGDAFAFVDDEVESVLRDASRLLYLPFLHGSPYGALASGGFVGLRGWHRRGHLLRALLEGVAFNHRTHVDWLRERLAVHDVRLTGGGAASPVWSQVFADVLRTPVGVAEAPEAGALGAAICAGVGAGLYRSLEQGVSCACRLQRVHEPTPERSATLDAAYVSYTRVVEALRPLWPELCDPA